MAEKKFNSSKAKEDKEKRKKMLLIVGSFVVAITMVLSGLLMSNFYNPPQQPQNPVDVVSDLNLKTSEEVTFYVENFSDEFVYFTNAGFAWDTLNYMKNMSVKGVQKIEIVYVEKKYFIFRFKLDNNSNYTSDDAFNNIYNNFRFLLNIEDKNTLLGVYDGYGYGIAKRFKIFAPVSTQPDDFVTGAWYIMKTNTTTQDIALVSKIVEKCSNMSAIVKNITVINVEGLTDEPKILEKLNIKANIIKIENPKIELNNSNNDSLNILLVKNLMNKYAHNISKNNISNISAINFADFTIKVKNLENLNKSGNLNKTYTNVSNTSIEIVSFEFNSTKEEIENLLKNENLTGTKIKYNIEPGKLTFGIDANEWNAQIYKALNQNLKNLTTEKQGTVSVADSCVNVQKLVVIPKNTDFNAIVHLNRSVNDTINVNINLYSMTGGGEEKYIPYLAVDTDLK